MSAIGPLAAAGTIGVAIAVIGLGYSIHATIQGNLAIGTGIIFSLSALLFIASATALYLEYLITRIVESPHSDREPT